MIKVLDDHVMVCVDCLMAVANNDFTGLDYHLDQAAAEARAAEIRDAIDNIDGHIAPGDSELDEEFSTDECECCRSPLAGSRHHCVVLGDGND